jgi:hypothetical protein
MYFHLSVRALTITILLLGLTFATATRTPISALSEDATLTIRTADVAEPVPEPTTMFGSALALSLGGWLKRKKSSQQKKTTPQH